MAGRAQLMSPGQAYEMGGSRFGVPLKVLTNKKALDLAMQKHTWIMQEQAQTIAGGAEKQHIAGQYGLKQQELQNERYGKSSLEASVLAQAVKMAQDNAIDMETPEGQQQFTNIYQTLLRQVKGEPAVQPGAENLAGGQPPFNPPEITAPDFDPNVMFSGPSKSQGKPLDPATAKKLLKRAGGDKEKARALAKKLGYTF